MRFDSSVRGLLPTKMPETTLLGHELFERDGKWFRRTTVSDKANYVVGKGGSIRHANVQFKGSKKDRKRFKAACLAAINTPVPDGFEEIQPDVILQDKPTLDIVYDVAIGEWTTTPYYQCTLTQLQQRFGTFIRAARVKADQPSTPTDSSSPTTVPGSPS